MRFGQGISTQIPQRCLIVFCFIAMTIEKKSYFFWCPIHYTFALLYFLSVCIVLELFFSLFVGIPCSHCCSQRKGTWVFHCSRQSFFPGSLWASNESCHTTSFCATVKERYFYMLLNKLYIIGSPYWWVVICWNLPLFL